MSKTSEKTYIRKIFFFDENPKDLIEIIKESMNFMKSSNISNKTYKKIIEQQISLNNSIVKRINNNINSSVRINNKNSNNKNNNIFYTKNYRIFENISLLTLEYEYKINESNNTEIIIQDSYKITTNTQFMANRKSIFNLIDKSISNENIIFKDTFTKYKEELDKLEFYLNRNSLKILKKFKENNKQLVKNDIKKILEQNVQNVQIAKRINNLNQIQNVQIAKKINNLNKIETLAQNSIKKVFKKESQLTNVEAYDKIKREIEKIRVMPNYFLDFTFEKGVLLHGEKSVTQSGGELITIILIFIAITAIILFYIMYKFCASKLSKIPGTPYSKR